MKKTIGLLSAMMLLATPVMTTFAQTSDEAATLDCDAWKQEIHTQMEDYKQQMKDNWSAFKTENGELNQFFDETNEDSISQRQDFRQAVRDGTTSMTAEDRRAFFKNKWNPIRVTKYTDEAAERMMKRFDELEDYVAASMLDDYNAWVDSFFDVFYANMDLYGMIMDMKEEYRAECYSEKRREYHGNFMMRLDAALKNMDADKLEIVLPRLAEKLKMMIEKTENSDMTDELKAIRLDMLYALLDLIEAELMDLDLGEDTEDLTDEDYDVEDDNDDSDDEDDDSDEDDSDDMDDDDDDDMDDSDDNS